MPFFIFFFERHNPDKSADLIFKSKKNMTIRIKVPNKDNFIGYGDKLLCFSSSSTIKKGEELLCVGKNTHSRFLVLLKVLEVKETSDDYKKVAIVPRFIEEKRTLKHENFYFRTTVDFIEPLESKIKDSFKIIYRSLNVNNITVKIVSEEDEVILGFVNLDHYLQSKNSVLPFVAKWLCEHDGGTDYRVYVLEEYERKIGSAFEDEYDFDKAIEVLMRQGLWR